MAEQLRQQGYAVEEMDCVSLCPHAPAIRVHDRFIHRATLKRVIARAEAPPEPDPYA